MHHARGIYHIFGKDSERHRQSLPCKRFSKGIYVLTLVVNVINFEENVNVTLLAAEH